MAALPGADLKKLYLSHSSFNKTFMSCPQKFYFYKFFPQPRGPAEDWAAMIGQALHKGWQEYMRTKDFDQACWAMILEFDVRTPCWKYEARTFEAAFSTLERLCGFVDDDIEWSLLKVNVNGELRPAIEMPFEIILLENGKPFELRPGLPVSYIGYCDAVMHSALSGELLPRDLKTHRRENQDLTPLYYFDEQIVPIALLLEHLLGNPLRDFDVEYVSTYVDILNPVVNCYKIKKSERMVQDWVRGLYVKLHELRNYVQMGWFRRNSDHCIAYSRADQLKVCGYFDVCQSPRPEYYEQYFSMGKKLEYVDQKHTPWVTLELEMAQ